jgi:DNA-damage-inducible protein D
MAGELEVFQDRIRRVWHEDEWWFSVVDVVEVLTDSPRPSKYWTDMKQRIQDEGFVELSAKCGRLKMRSADGKMRITDAANTETLLRIIQSIPSPKAEPFKRWLAQVGTERLQEEAEVSLAEERLMKLYQKKGYTDQWIHARLEKIRARSAVTLEWGVRGAKEGREFAQLTDTLSKGTFDITTGEHRQIKGISGKHNLQDSMTAVELALSTLAEVTTTAIHQERDSQGYNQLQRDCTTAGKISGNARREVEEATGKPVVTSTNYQQLQQERQAELQPPLFE